MKIQWPAQSQHVAPNSILRSVVFKWCDRLSGTCKCWDNNIGICCGEILRSFGRGVRRSYCSAWRTYITLIIFSPLKNTIKLHCDLTPTASHAVQCKIQHNLKLTHFHVERWWTLPVLSVAGSVAGSRGLASESTSQPVCQSMHEILPALVLWLANYFFKSWAHVELCAMLAHVDADCW